MKIQPVGNSDRFGWKETDRSQENFHYAAHGHTAAEVIYERADANKPFMGLTSFSGELPALKDIGVAKNYRKENELKILNNLVSGWWEKW